MSLFAVLLLAAAAGDTGPASPQVPNTALSALTNAASFCEEAIQTDTVRVPSGTESFMDMAFASSGIRAAADLPELIKRFAATQPMRMAGVQVYVRFPAGKASVWAIKYRIPACDIAVTGATDAPELGSAQVAKLKGTGWDSVRSVDASDKMPLAQHVLLKRKPLGDAPNNAIRVTMRWPTGTASDEDGIQLDMSYVAGDLKTPRQAAK